MKKAEEIKPSYAPVYAAALYPDLAKLFVRNGYALAVHGSLARDFDLIAVPWADKVESIATVMTEVMSTFAIRIIGNPETKNHGRIAFTLSVGFGECAVDLSFLPNTMNNVPS